MSADVCSMLSACLSSTATRAILIPHTGAATNLASRGFGPHTCVSGQDKPRLSLSYPLSLRHVIQNLNRQERRGQSPFLVTLINAISFETSNMEDYKIFKICGPGDFLAQTGILSGDYTAIQFPSSPSPLLPLFQTQKVVQ